MGRGQATAVTVPVRALRRDRLSPDTRRAERRVSQWKYVFDVTFVIYMKNNISNCYNIGVH